MGQKQVNILDPATDGVAEAAYFIESKGMLETAKKLRRWCSSIKLFILNATTPTI